MSMYLLGGGDVENLRRDHTKHLDSDAVKLIKAGPRTARGESFEEGEGREKGGREEGERRERGGRVSIAALYNTTQHHTAPHTQGVFPPPSFPSPCGPSCQAGGRT